MSFHDPSVETDAPGPGEAVFAIRFDGKQYMLRIEKVKDTGKILPGHGGILDRIDGLMFVVIVAFILIQINIIP